MPVVSPHKQGKSVPARTSLSGVTSTSSPKKKSVGAAPSLLQSLGESGAASPEESVEFLCKKFTSLFALLQQREGELQRERDARKLLEESQESAVSARQQLEQDRDALRTEVEALHSRMERSDNLNVAGLANMKADIRRLERERALLVEEKEKWEEEQSRLAGQLQQGGSSSSTAPRFGRSPEDGSHDGDQEEQQHDLESELNTVKLQRESLRAQCERKDTELRLQNERWKEEFNCFKLQKEDLQKTCRALATKSSRVNALLAETKELQQSLGAYKERLDALRAKNGKIESEAKLKDAKLEAVRESEDKMREQLRLEMAKNEELLADRKELEAGRVKLLQGLSSRSNQLDQKGEEIEALKRLVRELEEENKRLSGSKEGLCKAEAGHLEQIDTLKRERDSLQGKPAWGITASFQG
ncbi:unnamed protein product [Amoebophrya sp. A25]|nr:unnamed protein product [Amoebophrya sp. A25]|eukprot:GSA25T00021866001.1